MYDDLWRSLGLRMGVFGLGVWAFSGGWVSEWGMDKWRSLFANSVNMSTVCFNLIWPKGGLSEFWKKNNNLILQCKMQFWCVVFLSFFSCIDLSFSPQIIKGTDFLQYTQYVSSAKHRYYCTRNKKYVATPGWQPYPLPVTLTVLYPNLGWGGIFPTKMTLAEAIW